MVLGKTGSGKTLSAFVWASRMLAHGWQVVFFEPQGHARRLIRACGHGGAYYRLDMRQKINVLDVVVTRDEEGGAPPLAAQSMQVVHQLAILLGRSEPTASGEATFHARAFSNKERALLDHALQRLYAPGPPTWTRSRLPRRRRWPISSHPGVDAGARVDGGGADRPA